MFINCRNGGNSDSSAMGSYIRSVAISISVNRFISIFLFFKYIGMLSDILIDIDSEIYCDNLFRKVVGSAE